MFKFSQLAIVVLSAAILSGCNPAKEVRREFSGETKISEETRACYTPGVCLKCGLDLDMSMECGIKVSLLCPGKQKVTVSQTPIRIYFDDQSMKDGVEEKILKSEACS